VSVSAGLGCIVGTVVAGGSAGAAIILGTG
jgi:hypothetical protein